MVVVTFAVSWLRGIRHQLAFSLSELSCGVRNEDVVDVSEEDLAIYIEGTQILFEVNIFSPASSRRDQGFPRQRLVITPSSDHAAIRIQHGIISRACMVCA
jgi:hypothetical protein